MNILVAAGLLGLLLLGGCGKGGPSFPIGLYHVEDPALVKRVKEAGFDHILASGPSVAQVAKEARRRGLKVLAEPDTSLEASQVKGWPLAAWFLPDIKAQALSERVRAWDGRPQAFLAGQGGQARAYGPGADILMLEWFPVPDKALDTVAEQLDQAVRLLPPGKPLWFVVQAFEEKGRRFPDHKEIRFMSWLAVFHGAKGLFFSRLDRREGGTLLDAPELWQAVERVSRELKGFQPILEGGTVSPLPFPPDPFAVEARSWRYRGRQYVAVLNRQKKVSQRLPAELLKPRWRPLFAPRRDVKDLLQAEKGAWYVRPYQVLVFEGPLFGR